MTTTPTPIKFVKTSRSNSLVAATTYIETSLLRESYYESVHKYKNVIKQLEFKLCEAEKYWNKASVHYYLIGGNFNSDLNRF